MQVGLPFYKVGINSEFNRLNFYLKSKYMSKLLKDLFFDKDIVGKMKDAKPDRNILYNHLSNGRITLQEYLSIEKRLK